MNLPASSSPGRLRPRLAGLLSFLFWAVVFTLVCTQAPLYYSNQNQYFLHGLAHGGLGFLDADWLAGTADPTPVFSAVVALTYRFAHEWLYYVYFGLLLGVYLHSVAGIFTFLAGEDSVGSARLVFITLLAAIHSGAARWISVQLCGVDYPWYFQAGVAGQYLLGFGLQPSVFGVLLMLSIFLFVRGRPFAAATAAALAGVVHATYLLPAAFLVLAYMLVACTQRSWRRSVLLGGWALVLVLPVVIHNLVEFAPSSPREFAEAQRLLVHFRIPHHAVPEVWFDGIAMTQLVWIALAIWLVRGTVLFPVMLIPFFLSLTLSVLQVATANDTLSLLFPWRVSAVLVPLATAIVLARLVLRFARHGEPTKEEAERRLPPFRRGVKWVCVAVIALLVAAGIAINSAGLAYRSNPDELPLLRHVRAHARRGDVYLLPVDVPRLDAGKKGARSTSFTPPPLRDKDQHLIAIDLQRFRLFTGAAIVIDFKSIPYRDVEVLAWRDRLLVCRKLYRDGDWSLPAVRETLASFGVTHIVTTGRQEIRDKGMLKVFEDDKGVYRLYRIRK